MNLRFLEGLSMGCFWQLSVQRADHDFRNVRDAHHHPVSGHFLLLEALRAAQEIAAWNENI
jgi:hypothetical protein